LDALAQWDARPAMVNAALCGMADTLVPPAMSRACFPEERISWHQGGHLLPLEAPDWCATQLRALLEKLG
jgi:hypothetical protein